MSRISTVRPSRSSGCLSRRLLKPSHRIGVSDTGESEETMFGGRGFLSLPMVVGAVVIGVVSGKFIFGPPLEEYWTEKLREEAAKEGKADTR